MDDARISSLEITVADLAQKIPSEADFREAWLRDSILEKALKSRETWGPEQVLEVANKYYNWVKTGRTDIVH